MFTRSLVTLLPLLAIATACPEGPTFVTTDDASTGGTTSDTPTTSAASSSTGDDGTTSPTTGAASITTGDDAPPVIDCGKPAAECTRDAREWCVEMQALCADTVLAPVLGSGETDYCAVFAVMCDDALPPCQLCNYLLNTCNQLGGGDDCMSAAAECLCLADAHDLDI